MTSAITERNLLFGILAVQMSYLDAEQLLLGLNTWVNEKDKPLGQILCEKQLLLVQDRHLLEQFLDRHLERHGGIAGSLATWRVDPNLRQELEKCLDPQLQRSLNSLATPSHTPKTGSEPPPRTSLRYHVLRPHARGGLGQVSVALDEELRREVALKEIQPHLADHPANRARFILEAEITGRLEHPGIVPVYGLGISPEGRPFYAMRFIRGTSMQEAIERYHSGDKELSLRGLLMRFLAVCNTVAYAHSRGVIHRDLKPANIMLGPFGETLVVDWGLAKILDTQATDSNGGSLERMRLLPTSDIGMTAMGSAVGTPAFMPPEQANGRYDLIGIRSDVFALGATLYCLLTGAAPYGPNEALRQARERDLVRPRKRNSSVPEPLEAICLKAMAPDPRDRYSEATELARDVERWLADEPISVYRDPPRERVRRWANRHRVLVSATASLLITLVLGLAGGLWAVRQEQRRTMQALERAEENLVLAREAVDECFLLAMEDPQLQRPNMSSVKKLLLEKALPFYENFRAQRSQDADLAAVQADNFYRVGQIRSLIDRKQEAIASLEKAKEIQERLIEQRPHHRPWLGRLAQICNDLGSAHQSIGQWEQALELFERAREVQQQLVQAEPDNREHRLYLGRTLNNLALLQDNRNEPRKALTTYREACQVREFYLDLHPEDFSFAADLAGTYTNMASLLNAQGDTDLAWQRYEQARSILERLVADPRGFETLPILGATCNNLGMLIRRISNPRAAVSSLRRAVAVYEEYLRREPEAHGIRANLANTCTNLASALEDVGQLKEARDILQRAISNQEQLVQTHSDILKYRQDLGRAYFKLALLHERAGQFQEALKQCEHSRRHFENLLGKKADQPGWISSLAAAESHLGLLYARESSKKGLAVIESAIGRLRSALKKWPADELLQENLGHTLLHRASLLVTMGQQEEVVACYREAREIFEELTQAHPRTHTHRHNLATACMNLGLHLYDQGQHSSALALLQRARDLRLELTTEYPGVVSYLEELAKTWGNLGRTFRELGQPADSLDAFQQEYALQRKLVAHEPSNPRYRSQLAHLCRDLSMSLRNNQQARKGFELLLEARNLEERLVAENPANEAHQNNLARTYAYLSVFLRGTRQHWRALELCRQGYSIQKQVLRHSPHQLTYQIDFATTCRQIGQLLGEVNRQAEALPYLREGCQTLDELTKRAPGVLRYQLDRITTLRDLALTLDQLGQSKESLERYQEAVDLGERLIQKFPRIESCRSNLGMLYNNFGYLLRRQNQADRAQAAFKRCCQLYEELIGQRGSDAYYPRELARGQFNLGQLLAEQNKPDQALRSFDSAIKTLEGSLEKNPQEPLSVRLLMNCLRNRAGVLIQQKRFREALGDCQRLQGYLDRAEAPWREEEKLHYRIALTGLQAQTEEYRQASKMAHQLADGVTDGEMLYDLACTHALCASSMNRDERIPLAVREKSARVEADRAMHLLQRAAQAGFFGTGTARQHAQRDKDLSVLHEREDFKQLLREAEKRGSSQESLRP